MEKIYWNLCEIVKANNSLHTLPDDYAQIDKYIINADACSSSLSYLVGFVLKLEEGQNSALSMIRPSKFYSAILPSYCANLVILLKETFSAIFAILDNLPQIKLLPPSVRKILVIDAKPLYNLLSIFQKNNSLNSLFTSHPSIPLWISRLHQLVTQYQIQVFLMPSKHFPPADFATRPKVPLDPSLDLSPRQASVESNAVKMD